ncbi:SIMPL domain-containing protein [Mycobacterium sp. IDR2000157661]|uniref:SIMPL domain-containing protein n=1 Tax=Mycobacterium sp. IDR2000157661 TaxID=2867005 RepID=UPI001EEE9B1E|nr:SIMPL domain-containing protein [Mycobacterium sp. IDR2000157661]ULE35080.1 SIMPL domain-containing protein [Mycobacterium sp. IDR2000157661]
MPIPARSKTPTHLLVLAAAGTTLALAGCDAASGPAPAADTEVRQVTVLGSGEVQGVPDTLNVTASIEFTAQDVTGAMNQTSERQQAVIDTLVDAGVDRQDISTTEVSLQPQFSGAADNPQQIIGYRAINSIDVKIRQIDAASQALALIVSSGGDATRINSVNYSIDDNSQLLRDARSRAYNDAKERADQYAELSGLELGKVVSISEAQGPTPPTPLPSPRGAEMSAVPLEPGQQTVEFTVTVVWELA